MKVSLFVTCASEAQVDELFARLSEDGQVFMPLGAQPFSRKFAWLKDRFGVSWQVVPRQLNEMLESDDRAAAARAMEAMLKMEKIEVEKLREAYEGVPA